MELTHSHATQNDEAHNMNTLTIICLFAGISFHLMATPGAMYDLLFRALSVVPVFMAIVINYPKFEQRLKAWRIKRKTKPRRR